MIHIVVVNGLPRAGKDTFIEFCKQQALSRALRTSSFSSIEPVRDMVDRAGISTHRKTPEDRELLATVGAALEAHSQWRSRATVSEMVSFARASQRQSGVFFLHVREPDVMSRIRKIFESAHVPHTWSLVIVRSPRAEKPVTEADRCALEMESIADFTVQNDGHISALQKKANEFLDWLERKTEAAKVKT